MKAMSLNLIKSIVVADEQLNTLGRLIFATSEVLCDENHLCIGEDYIDILVKDF